MQAQLRLINVQPSAEEWEFLQSVADELPADSPLLVEIGDDELMFCLDWGGCKVAIRQALTLSRDPPQLHKIIARQLRGGLG